jgi:hypothetical protein
LVYYRLYVTYTLAGFLFGLDQNNVCRDIEKIEPLDRRCLPTPQKVYGLLKRLRTPEDVERHFPGFLSFTDCTEQQISTTQEQNKKKGVLFRQKEKAYRKDTAYGQQPWPCHP